VENLLSPDSVRRLCWDPPEELSRESVERVLRGLGARQWQIDLTTLVLLQALLAAAAAAATDEGGLDEDQGEA
jgi:ribonuclease D